jgi:hypothetical protein
MTLNSVLFLHQPLKWNTKYLAVDNMTLKKMQIRKFDLIMQIVIHFYKLLFETKGEKLEKI